MSRLYVVKYEKATQQWSVGSAHCTEEEAFEYISRGRCYPDADRSRAIMASIRKKG